MDANKFTIRQNNFTDNQINIPISLKWDIMGIEQSIEEYEKKVITEVIGVGRDFEITRFVHEPETNELTDINYEFYFYSGGSMNDVNNWRINYISEGFTPQEIFYYTNNFKNSFFKLDLYDSLDDKKQTNYLTIIIPTQQGLKMDTMMQRTQVSIKKPKFILDYVGDKEGFFIYWLKKRNFLDISTFYMTAKFYNAKTGVFTKMMNEPQSSLGDKYSFDSTRYFYYGVQLDYVKHSYQVFNINPAQVDFGKRMGTTLPIKWYEYVNPT
jgi:hypothetical protein